MVITVYLATYFNLYIKYTLFNYVYWLFSVENLTQYAVFIVKYCDFNKYCLINCDIFLLKYR